MSDEATLPVHWETPRAPLAVLPLREDTRRLLRFIVASACAKLALAATEGRFALGQALAARCVLLDAIGDLDPGLAEELRCEPDAVEMLATRAARKGGA